MIDKYYSILACILFSIFAATQIFGYSNDYLTYKGAFSYYSDLSQYIWIEPSFILMARLLSDFDLGFPIYIFIVVFISLCLKVRVVAKYHSNFLPVFISYLATIYFLHEYTQVRFAIGLALFYYSFAITHDRSLMRWLLFGLSILFHYSMLLLIVIYLLSCIPMTVKRLGLSFLLAVFGALMFNPENLGIFFSNPRLIGYADQPGSINNLLTPGKLILYVPYILLYRQKDMIYTREYSLLHFVILFSIATISLPDVLTTRISGMGYFLAIIMFFKVKFKSNMMVKNLYFLQSLVLGSSIFTAILL